MQSIIQELKESGVPDSRVFFESFGKPMQVASESQPGANTKSTFCLENQKYSSDRSWNQQIDFSK